MVWFGQKGVAIVCNWQFTFHTLEKHEVHNKNLKPFLNICDHLIFCTNGNQLELPLCDISFFLACIVNFLFFILALKHHQVIITQNKWKEKKNSLIHIKHESR